VVGEKVSLKNELKDLKLEIKRLSFPEKFFGAWCLSIMLIAIIFVSWSIYDMSTNPEKYAKETQERAVAEQQYNDSHTYEIISVEEYIRVTTNQFGAVTDQSPAYSIWYKDTSQPGGVDLIEDIEFHEYGIHKMVLGDKDTITFRQDGGITVRLTEETMRGM
jgi:hypothetical protein